MYKTALRIRSELDLGQGSFDWVEELCNGDVLAFKNTDVLVIHNFGDTAISSPEGEELISGSSHSQLNQLLPNETKWIKI
jgi:alpha-glucosidase